MRETKKHVYRDSILSLIIELLFRHCRMVPIPSQPPRVNEQSEYAYDVARLVNCFAVRNVQLRREF